MENSFRSHKESKKEQKQWTPKNYDINQRCILSHVYKFLSRELIHKETCTHKIDINIIEHDIQKKSWNITRGLFAWKHGQRLNFLLWYIHGLQTHNIKDITTSKKGTQDSWDALRKITRSHGKRKVCKCINIAYESTLRKW